MIVYVCCKAGVPGGLVVKARNYLEAEFREFETPPEGDLFPVQKLAAESAC